LFKIIKIGGTGEITLMFLSNVPQRYVENIEKEAHKEGISVKLVFEVGRFGIICVDIMKKENPKMIIITRSKRPEWVKKLFGSPVSYLIENASCPVIEQ
jgi:nucleotide-binding universal stress UspA family protein